MADKEISQHHDIANGPDEKRLDREHQIGLSDGDRNSESLSFRAGTTDEGQIFSMSDIDPVLDAKMRLLNRVRYPLTPLDKTVRRLMFFLFRPSMR